MNEWIVFAIFFAWPFISGLLFYVAVERDVAKIHKSWGRGPANLIYLVASVLWPFSISFFLGISMGITFNPDANEP